MGRRRRFFDYRRRRRRFFDYRRRRRTNYPTPFPTPYPTPAPTGVLGHHTCKYTSCRYVSGQTEIFTFQGVGVGKAFKEDFHCEKFGSGCRCACHKTLRAPSATTTLPATRRPSSTAKLDLLRPPSSFATRKSFIRRFVVCSDPLMVGSSCRPPLCV